MTAKSAFEACRRREMRSIAPSPPGRIGLLGGTFDPVHNGHLAVARAVRDQLGLERLLLIPASRPPHKLHYPITPFATRAAMIQEALVDEPTLGLSLIEQETSGPSFSIDTLERLATTLDPHQSYFIIGADAFSDIPSWKRFHEIPAHTNLVVVNRDDAAPADLPEKVIRRYFPEFSRGADGVWRAEGQGDIVLVGMERVDISSTMVRDLVRRGGDISRLVPSAVAVAIVRQGLYGER